MTVAVILTGILLLCGTLFDADLGMMYCEGLVPTLERYKIEHGDYPNSIRHFRL